MEQRNPPLPGAMVAAHLPWGPTRTMDDSQGFSIAICCYNSATRIESSLRSIAQLEAPGRSVEILLIDNCCSDDTVAVAQAAWEKLGHPWLLRVVTAAPAGLSNARRKAIQEARGDLILFCDDDNLLNPNYLVQAEAVMDTKPEVGCLGGQAYPIFPAELKEIPIWFYTYASYYAIGSQHFEAGDLTAQAYIWGAGMVARSRPLKALLAHGLSFAVSDRSGGSLESGGDTELALWMILCGYRLWYSPDLIFGHLVPSQRLSLSYVSGLHQGFERAKQTTRLYEEYLKRRKRAEGHAWWRRQSTDALGMRRFLRRVPRVIRSNCLTIARLRPQLAPHS